MNAIGELVIDGEVVVALTAFRLGDHLAAAHADGLERMRFECPAGHVEIMDVLFDDVVAAEPEEVIPVADLVLGVAPAGLALVGPDVALVPVDLRRTRSPMAPSWIRFRRFEVAGLVAALGAGDDRQALLVGFFVGGQHLADAGAVDGDRLLGEEMLAGLDRGLDVLGPEARRGRQHDQVAAVNDFLIGVEADEAAIVGNVEFLLAVLVVRGSCRGSS